MVSLVNTPTAIPHVPPQSSTVSLPPFSFHLPRPPATHSPFAQCAPFVLFTLIPPEEEPPSDPVSRSASDRQLDLLLPRLPPPGGKGGGRATAGAAAASAAAPRCAAAREEEKRELKQIRVRLAAAAATKYEAIRAEERVFRDRLNAISAELSAVMERKRALVREEEAGLLQSEAGRLAAAEEASRRAAREEEEWRAVRSVRPTAAGAAAAISAAEAVELAARPQWRLPAPLDVDGDDGGDSSDSGGDGGDGGGSGGGGGGGSGARARWGRSITEVGARARSRVVSGWVVIHTRTRCMTSPSTHR